MTEYHELGIQLKIRYLDNWEPEEIAGHLDAAVADGSDGIAVYATNDSRVLEKIREITASGIPVVIMGSEIDDCGQLGFVGGNAIRAGRTAAGLIRLIRRGEIRLGIIRGYRSSVYHHGRVKGLLDELERMEVPYRVLFNECNNDDEFDCFDITKEQMQLHPEVNVLFLSTSSVYGACRALQRMNLPTLPRIVCYDNTPGVREMVAKGVIAASIGQEPERQGREAVRILAEYLVFGILPEQPKVYTENKIYFAENL